MLTEALTQAQNFVYIGPDEYIDPTPNNYRMLLRPDVVARSANTNHADPYPSKQTVGPVFSRDCSRTDDRNSDRILEAAYDRKPDETQCNIGVSDDRRTTILPQPHLSWGCLATGGVGTMAI